MTASFPGSIKSFGADRVNGDYIQASDVNDMRAEIVAVETELRNGGWIEVSDTWTYASPSTINVPTDATTVYQKGDRVRFKQGGGYKYGTIVALTATLATIAVNTDFTVANAGITNIAYSRQPLPYGFPQYFNFTPGWTGFTPGSATIIARYAILGNKLDFSVNVALSGSTVSTPVRMTLPVSAASMGTYLPIGAVSLVDTGTALYMGEAILNGSFSDIELRVINAAATYATWAAISSTVPHTWANTDVIEILGSYWI